MKYVQMGLDPFEIQTVHYLLNKFFDTMFGQKVTRPNFFEWKVLGFCMDYIKLLDMEADFQGIFL